MDTSDDSDLSQSVPLAPSVSILAPLDVVKTESDPFSAHTLVEEDVCEEACLRALDYILSISEKASKNAFKSHGGDVIFLLKNVCVKAKKGSRLRVSSYFHCLLFWICV